MKKLCVTVLATAFSLATFAQNPAAVNQVKTDVKQTSQSGDKTVKDAKKGDVKAVSKSSKEVSKDSKTTVKDAKGVVK